MMPAIIGMFLMHTTIHDQGFFWDWTRNTVPKPLQLPKARINIGDHQKSVEEMKLDEVHENELSCLGSRNEINQKRVPSEEVGKT